ncbi:MAG: hypothetical protein IJ703_01110 [Eubacterium sp.]|nr:hypothetical protein [Eubacterium sp.]
MKENEALENSTGKTFGEAASGFAKSAWTARNRYRGLNLEQIVQLLFATKNENGTERELTGEEVSERLADYRFADRLNDLTQIAFGDLNSPKAKEELGGDTIWDKIMIDGKSASELWGNKYKHIEDKAQLEQMYQLEFLREVFEGRSEIIADTPKDVVIMVPEGPRNNLRREILAEQSALDAAARANEPEVPEDEPMVYFEEEKLEAVEEIKTDSLTADSIDAFTANSYERLWGTNPGAGISASPASMLSVVFYGSNTAEEALTKYNGFGLKGMLDRAADEFMKEFDNPERTAFLKGIGADPLTGIKVNGQTLEERYGEKYKAVEDKELKEKFYKFELMNEITAAHLSRNKDAVPEISATMYELKEGSYQPVESKKIKVTRPVREVKVEQQPAPEEPKVEITPEQVKANILGHEEKILQDQIKMVKDPDAKLLDSTQAKWDLAKQANEIHKELKGILEKLEAVKKNKVQGKDTALYGNMINALKDCITLSDLDNPQANANKLMDALDKYNTASETYYNNRKGIIFGPGSDAGKLRLAEAKNAMARIPGQIEALKKNAGLAGHGIYRQAPFAYVIENAMTEAASIGSDKLKIDDFDGKFGVDYLENAARDYLKRHDMKVTDKAVVDIALDNDFINVVSRYPSHYYEKFDHFNAAKDYLKAHYNNIANDKTIDANTREHANEMALYNIADAAFDLMQNPDFVRMYNQSPDFYIQNIEVKNKAEAYLTEKKGEKPTAEEIKELSSNKLFKMISEKNPTDFGKNWDDNKKKADELKEKYKAELDEMTAKLEDYDVISYLKEYYDSDEKPNPEYEKALDDLKEKKAAFKEERERIYEERQALKEITDPEEKKQKQEQIEKDADALEKTAKSLKSGKADAVRNHLLPEYLARVSFLKTTQDPVKGENICRLMATNPRQEKEACKSILDNIKKPENMKVLKDKGLTDMIKDGSIVEKVVPGAQKPEQAKKPEAKKPQQEKKMEGGMARK